MSQFTPIDLRQYCNFGLDNVKVDNRWIWRGGESVSLDGLPIGQCEFYGIPFQIADPAKNDGKVLLLLGDKNHPSIPSHLEIVVGKQAAYVIIAHFSDMSYTHESGLMGTVAPGEVLANYSFHSADGTKVVQPIRRRFEISDYTHSWGQLAFNARPHSPEHPPDSSMPWGRLQTGQSRGPYATKINYWLYTYTNPDPKQVIEKIELASTGQAVIAVGAITLAHDTEHPFEYTPRTAVKIDFKDRDDADWDVKVKMDRGTVVKTSPLPGIPDDFTRAAHKGWGEIPERRPKRGTTYVEAYGAPSSQFIVKTSDSESSVRWGDVIDGGAESSGKKIKVEPLYKGKAWIHAKVVDAANGKPIPARVHFCGQYGEYFAPYGHQTDINPNWFEDLGGDLILGRMNYAYVDGEFQIELPIGTVYVEVVKGFEYQPVRRKLNIREGQRELKLPIKRWTNMNKEGYYSGDTHVHFLSTQTGMLEARSEDLNVANILAAQWGKLFTNVEEFTGSPSPISTKDTIIYVNTENRHHLLGHLILLGLKKPVYPLSSGGPSEDYLGGPNETSLAAWCDDCHDQGGLVIAPHFPNPHCELAADIALGKIDAAEIRPSAGDLNNYAVTEWYRYLNLGYRLPCVGGTDKMANSVPVGGLRTYAYVGRKPFTYKNWCNAIRKGRSFTSTGPIIYLKVDGHNLGDTINMSSSGGTVEIEANAACAHRIDRLQIIQNGKVIAETASSKTGRHLVLKVKYRITESCWLAARCWGTGNFWTTAAHTSPIYIYLGRRDIFSHSDASYMLTLIEGGITWANNLAVFRDKEKRHEILSVFEAGRKAIENKKSRYEAATAHP